MPQLRTITLGGAVTGLGIESTSFRSGLPHESVLEMDVFTGAGEVVTTRPGDDLFDTFPNSYGSLGYATRLRIELEPVPSYVALRHVRFDDAGLLAKTVAEIVETGEYDGARVDGLDGVAFAPGEYYLTLATLDATGSTGGAEPSDYTGQQIYYRSIQRARDRPADHLRLPVALGHRLVLVLGRVRRPAPASCAGSGRGAGGAPTSTTGWSASTAASASPTGSTAAPGGRSASGSSRTSRSRRAARGVPRLVRRRGRDAAGVAVPAALARARAWPTYPLDAGRDLRQRRLLGHRPRRPRRARRARATARSRRKVHELGGHKSLYSEAFYDRETFDRLYDGANLAARQAALRPRRPADQPLRQGGDEDDDDAHADEHHDRRRGGTRC